MRNPVTLLLAVTCLAPVPSTRAEPSAAVNFNRDIRPILSDNCFACHGPDDAKRKAGLRLDLRDAALKPTESGAVAIVPGKLDDSALIKRITSSNPDEKMPPPESKKHLSAEQVDLLRRWVAEGAAYQIHWAFAAPVRPAVPMVKDEAWVRNPVDRFVLARLEAEAVKPGAEGDKVTLLRRLHLDLVGLPPAVEAVDAFVADNSPDAYEKAVERLLASPHYGERWGRHWLDAARYADSDGFEKDKSRQAWFYRDYVINAFNRDLPYDRFVVEQLAGDLLPDATQEQVVATGFLRNSMVNEEGGVDPEQFRMDAMFDRMDAIGKGILGLTIQCAQCHSHKYDPLTHEEYYKLFAFINNDHEAQRVVYSPDEQMKIADLMRQMREAEAELKHRTPDWEAKRAEWEQQVSQGQPEWTALPIENARDNSQGYATLKDHSLRAGGYAPTKWTAAFRAKTNLTGVTAFRLELLTDNNLPCGGPGRSFKGTSALTDFWVEAAPVDQPDKPTRLKIVEATADYDQPEAELEPNFDDKTKDRRVTGPVKYAIDGDPKTAWGIDAGPGRRNQSRKAVFKLESPLTVEAGKEVVLTFHVQQNHGGWNSDDHMNNNLGRFRISATTAGGAVSADPLAKRVRDALARPNEQRTPQQAEEIFSYWRTTVPEWKEANERIEALWKQWPAGSTTLTLMAREKDDPRPTHVLNRGDWLKPTKPIGPGVPAFLHALPADAEPTRLAFAKWLVDPKAPTTARVFVNRVWQQYFGTGLVATSEDFGIQSEPPSHPELLDWLAIEFQETGWSVKQLHRLIVNSATYRQDSKVTPAVLAKDPFNRLLGRGARLRVEGEVVRDVALASSGLLNPRIGGPSIMTPAPAFLFVPPASYAPFPWVDETGPDKYRRAIYTFRRRSTPYPVLQTFDVPNADASCVRRLRSNTPLQALVTLNEPIFVEAARALGRKMLEEGGATDAERVAYGFRRVLSRVPTDAEQRELLSLMQKQHKRFADGWLNASVIATGEPKALAESDLPKGATPAQWAAYTVVARVLLNLDEAITKE